MESNLEPLEIQARQTRILKLTQESTPRFNDLLASTPWQVFADTTFLKELIHQAPHDKIVSLYQEIESRPFKDQEFNKYIVQTNGDLTSTVLQIYLEKLTTTFQTLKNHTHLKDEEVWIATAILQHPNQELLKLLVNINQDNIFIITLLYISIEPELKIYNLYDKQDYLVSLINLDKLEEINPQNIIEYITLILKTNPLKSTINTTDSWGRNLLHLLLENRYHNLVHLNEKFEELVDFGVDPNHRAIPQDQNMLTLAKIKGNLPKNYGKTPNELLQKI